MIDLHTHSTFSDGTFTPAEIVEHAMEKGVEIVSLTDHDTVNGNDEFIKAGEKFGVKVIAGLEVSVEYSVKSDKKLNGAMHILGYFPNWNTETKNKLSLLEEIRENRKIRNPKIIDKLRNLGLDITLNEVAELANNDVLGRPHIARILVKKGHVKDMKQAFSLYLAKGAEAYVSRSLPTPKEAIKMILNAGGVPVLAHPISLRIYSEKDFVDLLEQLISYGLQGIEVVTASSKWDEIQRFLGYAYLYDLVATVGSDFHGVNKSSISLGIKYNFKINTETDCVKQLFHRASYCSSINNN